MSAVNIGDMLHDGADLTGQNPALPLLTESHRTRTKSEGNPALPEAAQKAPPRSMTREVRIQEGPDPH
ncbi:hypothetical protein [Streptomyces sp. NPDC005435]|uniref:hypothetical protein n=1 Tax=Streptomyces sp. NPDC005435 TaxID=3154464 RepID=UPI003452C179